MNPGGLCLHEGVLFVAGYDEPGSILAFDLDGRRLESGVLLEVEAGARPPSISGLAVDSDRKLWAADAGSGRVRCLNLFGQESGSFVPVARDPETPLGGQVPGPGLVDVALAESSKWTGIFAAVAGRRIGAIGIYLPDGTKLHTLRSEGNPKAPFRRIVRIATAGDLLFVVESGARRVQVFRAGEFHFAFPAHCLGEKLTAAPGTPRALAPVGDGRLVIAVEHSDSDQAAAQDQATGPNSDSAPAAPGPNSGLFLLSGLGAPLAQLAPTGAEEGQIQHPVDVVVESILPWPGESQADLDRRRRVVVLDQDGARVQVFTLAGRCYGSFSLEGTY